MGHTTISCTRRLAWSWPAMSSQLIMEFWSRISLHTCMRGQQVRGQGGEASCTHTHLHAGSGAG